MLKAGALYFAIVMAFIIAVLSASILMLAAHYRSGYLKEIRLNRLLNNLDSGMEILLSDEGLKNSPQTIDLFGNQLDSVLLAQRNWGIFPLGLVKAFVNRDTLKRVFWLGKETTQDQEVLYLSDEDRPISVSGETRLTGNAVLPKAGLRQSYVEGKPYTGNRLVYGPISDSKRSLKGLDQDLIDQLKQELSRDLTKMPPWTGGQLNHSFFDSTARYRVDPSGRVEGQLSGNLILYSDTTVILSATAVLNQVQVYAPGIVIEEGFQGNCQLFASDSIRVGKAVHLAYPSVLGVLRAKEEGQPKVVLEEEVRLQGMVFSWEETRTPLQTLLALGKSVVVDGELYSTGLIQLEKKVRVNGKVSCNRFMLKTPNSLYENFLVDAVFNRKARNQYYLGSTLFTGQTGAKKVLKWLN